MQRAFSFIHLDSQPCLVSVVAGVTERTRTVSAARQAAPKLACRRVFIGVAPMAGAIAVNRVRLYHGPAAAPDGMLCADQCAATEAGGSPLESLRPLTHPCASRAEPTITRQPALAPSPQPRPAPTGRTLIVRNAKRGGPSWMPIWGPDRTPIDNCGHCEARQEGGFHI
jgi:hypothetical protein